MRLDGWDAAFNNLIKSRRHTPFVWGTHDCCLFAADCALVITGHDFAETFRGKYDSAVGATKQILARGGFESMITSLLGGQIPLAYIRRGDVAMIDQDGSPALAVCVGAQIVAAGPDGLAWLPLSAGITAWRVE